MIKDRLAKLRELMSENNIDVYLVLTEDFHGSEYVGDYFKSREFISGFDGSAGSVVVTKTMAYLWTDGRYFIQAKNQLKDSGIELKKMGEDETILEFLEEKAKTKDSLTVAMDGRCISASLAEKISKINNIKIIEELDLVGEIWSNRPIFKSKPVWILDEKYCGVSALEKLENVKKETREDYLLVTSLDEIAWLLNLRGDDIAYTPVFYSYFLMDIKDEKNTLYISGDCIGDDVKKYLMNLKIEIKEYNEIFNDVKNIKDSSVRCSKHSLNFRLKKSFNKSNNLILDYTPIYKMKAIKNKVECDNMKKAHLMDGVSLIKFLYRLKAGEFKNVNEYRLGEILGEYKSANPTYVEESFEPIVGCDENGAIIHYSPKKEESKNIGDSQLVLIDAGSHYLEGTTDITRTISLGKVTEKMKHIYTAVLKGHLRLQNMVFKKGCSGTTLDGVAREALWKEGLDYNHGTGHGVGYLLSVHEGPNSIRFRVADEKISNIPFEKGMITSNEPGCYIEGEFGVRIENLILCEEENEGFLKFEPLTLVPYDKNLIDYEKLDETEKKMLKEYGELVVKSVGDKLESDELDWLKQEVSFN